MTYSVWLDGRFMARFATRDGALGWVQAQPGAPFEYEITDESDEL
jgi:hypothetical protein